MADSADSESVCEEIQTYPMPAAASRILRPSDRITVSHWCDRHRRLSARFAASPGPWRTSVVPYLREPLDAFADPTVNDLTFIKPSRVGGTEWTNNCIAWAADNRPMPAMYVLPEKPDVEDEFSGRIRLLFEESPKLREHIPSGEWATTTQIDLDWMTLYGAWASSPNTLIRKTIGFAFFDEIDNTEAVAGSLGNTLDLLEERLVTFGYMAKLVKDGTPKRPDGSGWMSLQASDYRKPYVPCPFCGLYQVLYWNQLIVPEGERDPDRIEAEQLARFRCAGCETMIPHDPYHRWMINRVVWIAKTQEPAAKLPLDELGMTPEELVRLDPVQTPSKSRRWTKAKREAMEIVQRRSLAVPPFDPWDEAYAEHRQWAPELAGEPMRTPRRGYWLNVLYSPWPTRTWSHIMARWFRVKNNPDRKQVYINSWRAEPFEEVVKKLDSDKLGEKRKGALPRDIVPSRARILTMGADVQGDFMYYVIRAWGPHEESWLIREGTVETFDELYRIAFFTGYPVAGDMTKRMRCFAMAIDSGFRTDEVYTFACKPGVHAVKGEQSADYRTKPSKIDHLPKGGRDPFSLIIQHVNTGLFKTKVHRLAGLPEDDAGAWHLNADASDEYCKQFTNEQQIWEDARKARNRRSGRRRMIWAPKTGGARVDYLDCEVYSAALADILNAPLLGEDSNRVGLMDKSPAARSRKKKIARSTPKGGSSQQGFLG